MSVSPLSALGTRIAHEQDACDRAMAVTKSLLGYLVLAGPFYVLVSLAQALTRAGFSVRRDEWSLLALGHLGWIQDEQAWFVPPGACRSARRRAFAIAFLGIASGDGSAAINLGFTVAVIITFGWLSYVAVRLYRTVAPSGLATLEGARA